MISVCIYSLRDAMRTVQKTFDIPIYGTQHTTPDMLKEVNFVAEKLREEKVQEYVEDRAANEDVDPARDLLAEGSKYANKRSAFSKHQTDDAILENLGYQGDVQGDMDGDGDEDMDGDEEFDYIPTAEDLAMDDEEPIDLADELLEGAMALMEGVE